MYWAKGEAAVWDPKLVESKTVAGVTIKGITFPSRFTNSKGWYPRDLVLMLEHVAEDMVATTNNIDDGATEACHCVAFLFRSVE